MTPSQIILGYYPRGCQTRPAQTENFASEIPKQWSIGKNEQSYVTIRFYMVALLCNRHIPNRAVVHRRTPVIFPGRNQRGIRAETERDQAPEIRIADSTPRPL